MSKMRRAVYITIYVLTTIGVITKMIVDYLNNTLSVSFAIINSAAIIISLTVIIVKYLIDKAVSDTIELLIELSDDQYLSLAKQDDLFKALVIKMENVVATKEKNG